MTPSPLTAHPTFAECHQYMSDVTRHWSREELVVSLTHKAETIDALLVQGQALTARITGLRHALRTIAGRCHFADNDAPNYDPGCPCCSCVATAALASEGQ